MVNTWAAFGLRMRIKKKIVPSFRKNQSTSKTTSRALIALRNKFTRSGLCVNRQGASLLGMAFKYMILKTKNVLLAASFLFVAGTLHAEDSAPSAGDKIVEMNKEIKAKREVVASCETAKKDDPECKKAGEELSKMRDDREAAIKALPEGTGLRKKIRKEIANDRIQVRREKLSEESGVKE